MISCEYECLCVCFPSIFFESVFVRTSPSKFAKNTRICSFKLFHTKCLTISKYVVRVFKHMKEKRFSDH